ncbi:MAG: DUF4157 domain-containing protein [Methanosarcina sp.]
MPEYQQTKKTSESKSNIHKQTSLSKQIPVSNPMAIIQHARIDPKSLTSADILQLQRTIGNRAVGRLLSEIRNLPMGQQEPIQRQKPEEEETCLSCVQRREILKEEEKPLQGVFENKSDQVACPLCIQRKELEEEELLQTMRKSNTGMPDNLKAGVESLSGIDMSDVRVHYNSSKPAEVGALAYTQGTNIHVAPGQEKYLPHEAWHVVQQKQGRVQPTMQMRGVLVNDSKGLENEADYMGAKATAYTTQFQSVLEEHEWSNNRKQAKRTVSEQKEIIVKKSLLLSPRADSTDVSCRQFSVQFIGLDTVQFIPGREKKGGTVSLEKIKGDDYVNNLSQLFNEIKSILGEVFSSDDIVELCKQIEHHRQLTRVDLHQEAAEDMNAEAYGKVKKDIIDNLNEVRNLIGESDREYCVDTYHGILCKVLPLLDGLENIVFDPRVAILLDRDRNGSKSILDKLVPKFVSALKERLFAYLYIILDINFPNRSHDDSGGSPPSSGMGGASPIPV